MAKAVRQDGELLDSPQKVPDPEPLLSEMLEWGGERGINIMSGQKTCGKQLRV